MKRKWNTIISFLVLAAALIILSTLSSGCHPYPYGEYEVAIEGEGYYIYWEHQHYYYYEDSSLLIKIDWDNDYCADRCSSKVDLDLELETPSGYLVPTLNTIGDGCEHLGDDPGRDGFGSEAIVCDYPSTGSYEIRLVNLSDKAQLVTVTSTLSNIDYYSDTADQKIQEVLVEPLAMAVVPLYVGSSYLHKTEK